jgi:hypothetical protein
MGEVVHSLKFTQIAILKNLQQEKEFNILCGMQTSMNTEYQNSDSVAMVHTYTGHLANYKG